MSNNNEALLWDSKYSTSRAYERVEDVFLFSKNNPTLLALEPYIREGMSILEIGSGTGELISYIQYKYPRCKTFGIDFSEQSIEKSTQIASRFSIPVSFIRADIQHMPFDDQSFDVVFGDQVIGHIIDLNKALSEVHRVTKKEGIVAFSIANSARPDGWYFNKTFSKSHQGYIQKGMFPWTLSRGIRNAGFKKIKFYGDMLFLFRNISLIKSFLGKTVKRAEPAHKVLAPAIKSNGFIKRMYYFLEGVVPSWAKVTIGIVAQK